MKRRTRDESGASAVEFALVFPVLALLLFGIISYGYMFTVRQAMTQAAAEGARAGAVAPEGTAVDKASSAVNDALGGTGLKCGERGLVCTTALDSDCDSASGGDCVKVTLTLNYKTFDPFKLPLVPMPGELEFTSQAEVN
ncbi:TadE/TadG family type IV pilus assembly protein [Nocardioides sp. AE5]|uniref:TadE/TadG family type IV pilus assembly protein n=1 Tax=Nocardioides sp. AE5 TaxID=2962573 RepID=UPI002882ADD2|nr:TadE/TadG family type IV pilus assembly protein [Nocardioides sp. AE5]MDT0203264.1 pilus assembly protein [Nocardioides sp. AE5]